MGEVQVAEVGSTRRRVLAAAGRWAVAACAAAIGCRGSSDSASSGQRVLQLNWYPDAQHGGFYAAELQGLLSDGELNVKIAPGGPSITSLNKLVLKQVDFAIANADQILLARAQQADVVAVFAALQHSPRCVMVHAAAGIESWDQLNNVTLAIGEGQPFAEFLKSRLPMDKVRLVPYTGDISAWLLDPRYTQQAYSISEPLLAELRGGDPRVLMVSDLGYDPYTSVVVVRRDTWNNDRSSVQRVVDAMRTGWQHYLDEPDETNKRIHEINPTMELEVLKRAAKAVAPLCLNGLDGPHQIGTMSLQRWETMHQQLLDLGMLDRPERDIANVFVS